MAWSLPIFASQEHASGFICISFSMVYSINLSRRILLLKVKVSLCFINYAICHEDILDSGSIAPPFLTSALHRGEQSASHPGCFIPKERGPGSHWIEGCVGPGANLDIMEKRKVLPLQRIKPQPFNPLSYPDYASQSM
jgi:hypothetical protein